MFYDKAMIMFPYRFNMSVMHLYNLFTYCVLQSFLLSIAVIDKKHKNILIRHDVSVS